MCISDVTINISRVLSSIWLCERCWGMSCRYKSCNYSNCQKNDTSLTSPANIILAIHIPWNLIIMNPFSVSTMDGGVLYERRDKGLIYHHDWAFNTSDNLSCQSIAWPTPRKAIILWNQSNLGLFNCRPCLTYQTPDSNNIFFNRNIQMVIYFTSNLILWDYP